MQKDVRSCSPVVRRSLATSLARGKNSTTFTGEWDTGNIYNPPNRRWSFDTLFSTNPPPGSPDAVVMTRGSWAKF